jgi:hypothetical protein
MKPNIIEAIASVQGADREFAVGLDTSGSDPRITIETEDESSGYTTMQWLRLDEAEGLRSALSKGAEAAAVVNASDPCAEVGSEGAFKTRPSDGANYLWFEFVSPDQGVEFSMEMNVDEVEQLEWMLMRARTTAKRAAAIAEAEAEASGA